MSRKTTPTYPRRTPRTQQGGDSITIVMSKKDCNEGTDPQITAYLLMKLKEYKNNSIQNSEYTSCYNICVFLAYLLM